MSVNQFRTVVELYGSANLIIKGRNVSGGIEIKACDVDTKMELAVFKRLNSGALQLIRSNVNEAVLYQRVYPNIKDSSVNIKRDLELLGKGG
jgi:hypothetical protein